MGNILLEIMKNVDDLENLENNRILDFTKKEDIEKLENAINSLRKTSLFSCFFEDSIFDNLLEKAKKIYNDAHQPKEPIKPSTKVSDNIKKNVNKLANEYVNTFIVPYVKKETMTEEIKHDMIDALYEFGCWVYQK